MPLPLISIILPFYNAGSALSRSAVSILSQSYPSWELILVDNASTDPSSATALNLAKRHSEIIYIHEPTRGVVHAFNAGLTVAKGQFIARMDADDVAYPHRLEKQSELLNQRPDVAAVGGLVRYQSDTPRQGMEQYANWTNTLRQAQQIALNRFVELPVVNPTLMFRRESLNQYGSYRSGNYPEDYELILRWLAEGQTFAKVNEVVLDWYDIPTRLTRTDSRYTADAFFRIKSQYLAEWLHRYNRFHPQVVVWGAGRRSRRRARMLESFGVIIDAFIDIVPDKTTERTCIHYQDIAEPGHYFIVSYVSNRGQRDQIRSYLLEKGYQEGVNFLLAA